jgi:hypothetical protein
VWRWRQPLLITDRRNRNDALPIPSHPTPVACCSAFGWLLSILLASLVWLAIPMLKVRTGAYMNEPG